MMKASALPQFSAADMDGVRRLLSNPTECAALVDAYYQHTDTDEAAVMRTLAHTSLGNIDRMVESPIERLLFSALVVLGLSDPASVVVRSTSGDALQLVEQMRRNCQAVRALGVIAKKRKQSRRDFILEGRASGIPDDAVGWMLQQDIVNALLDESFHVILQASIPAKRMRVDALVFVPARPTFLVAVECDGYEWHGDKEAFTADRQRDRELCTLGCNVVRFSGTEIHANPLKAAHELATYLVDVHRRSKKPRTWVYPEEVAL